MCRYVFIFHIVRTSYVCTLNDETLRGIKLLMQFSWIFNKPQEFYLLISIRESCFCSYYSKPRKFPYIMSCESFLLQYVASEHSGSK